MIGARFLIEKLFADGEEKKHVIVKPKHFSLRILNIYVVPGIYICYTDK